MKLETALRYANEVARRVRSVSGLLAAPLCRSEAVTIKRIWVFGSTAKASITPNDLDLLIEMTSVGRRYTHDQARIDKECYRRYGYLRAPRSDQAALTWLTKECGT
jgi:predicted nucleotidyltransferase